MRMCVRGRGVLCAWGTGTLCGKIGAAWLSEDSEFKFVCM